MGKNNKDNKFNKVDDREITMGFTGDFNTAKKYMEEGKKVIFVKYASTICRIWPDVNEEYLADDMGCNNFLSILVAKNRTGIRSINKIISFSYLNHEMDPDVFTGPSCSWEHILENRDGLLVGRVLTWAYIRKLTMMEPDDDTLDYLIEQKYGKADFVQVRGERLMYNIPELDDDGEPIPESEEDGIMQYKTVSVTAKECREMESMAIRIVKSLKKLGIILIADFNTATISEEDLKDYEFYGESLAGEIVTDNIRVLASQVEDFDPFPENEKGIHIPNAYEELKNRCYSKIYELFEEEPPVQYLNRLEEELSMIKAYDHASYYLLASLVADKCRELHVQHLVRGCAGGSLVAYLSGITHTNPLPPHYYCPSCGYTEFLSDGEVSSGYDLVSIYQSKVHCPKCGRELAGEGHDIPFEVFAGADGSKRPYFEMDVPESVKSEIVDYFDEIFGKDKVYYSAGKELAGGDSQVTMPVRRTDELIIVPADNEIYDYAPVRYYSRYYRNAEWDRAATTYECWELKERGMYFHINSNPVLDTLQELWVETSVDPDAISIDKIDYHSFFEKGEHKDIPLGCAKNIPDEMIESVFVCSFSDVVRLMGYSSVWKNNAETEYQKNITACEKTIAHREDVMNTLIGHGIERKEAYRIMEIVRKGKAAKELTSKDIEYLKARGISDDYISSMMKIRYLFPKAHDTEYAGLLLRLMWYKVNYPKEYEEVVIHG
ncbi:MAG: hypothetical protein E7271_00345 [Lachnospiraceae bacterium]|nr:hypothetical protein [Lachnospiraceae bacterium]